VEKETRKSFNDAIGITWFGRRGGRKKAKEKEGRRGQVSEGG